jgi:hypothetical protein
MSGFYKIFGALIVGWFTFVSFTGKTFWSYSSERKWTPKGKREYHHHK